MFLSLLSLNVFTTFSILLVGVSVGGFIKSKFRASFKREHVERFEFTGAIHSVIVLTKIGCFETCFLDNNCLSLFYNDNTKQCVLHSKDFIFKSPQLSGTGWTHYVIDGK